MPPSSPKFSHPRDFVDLPRWSWLWLPIIYVAVQYGASLFSYAVYDAWFRSETGINEIVTVLLALTAAGTCFGLTVHALRAGDWLMTVWLGIGALGCFYFAGEEASWGQHWFGWGTPEEWAGQNDQAETNLHNLTGVGKYFDQVPRTLLTAGAIVGGILVPAWQRFRGSHFDPQKLWYWLFPTAICMPVALLAVLLPIPDGLFNDWWGKGWDGDISAGEIKECLLAWFLTLYALSLYVRWRQVSARPSALRD